MSAACRIVAIVIALAGVIDPALALQRPRPLAIQIEAGAFPEAAAIRQRLIADLDGHIAVGTGLPPAATVLIGRGLTDISGTVPTSVVSWSDPARANVRIRDISAPEVVLPGQEAIVSARFEGIGVVGQSSTIALQRGQVQLAAVEHKWTAAREPFVAEFRYVPPVTGIEPLRVTARPLPGESTTADNSADIGVTVRSRPLRIAAYDPRPSWAAGFVRRALEADPVFVVSSLVRASRGLAVRSGELTSLTREAIAGYDAVLIGAPEDLTSAEVTVVDAFARARGGAVVLLPDARPAGAYSRTLMPFRTDDILLERPIALDSTRAAGLLASELTVALETGRGAAILASALHAGVARPVIVSWPHGAGRLVFSGALDAWRYRAAQEDGFARFWSGLIANLAAAAPPPLAVRIDPAVAAPGDPLTLRATIRPSELTHDGSRIETPAVSAQMIAADGSQEPVRLWPTAEAGVFEAVVSAPTSGRYDIRVTTGPAQSADAALIVDADVRHPWPDDEGGRLMARVSGGVAVDAADLAPLEAHLRSLHSQTVTTTVRPMRWWGWGLACAGLLCAEWAVRRRQGRR